MRKLLTGLAVGLQVLVLVFMAGEREWVARRGEQIWMRTQPVDPRDPFRGDYVRLNYEANRIPTNRVEAGLLTGDRQLDRGRMVYAVLARTEDGLVSVEKLCGEKPGNGLFLRGRTEYFYSGHAGVPVKYGIEAYFVQEGKGRLIEEGRVRGEVRVPLDMEVAVGRNGMAVLKSHRWCPVGIGLHLENNTNRQVRAATVSIMNVSSNDIVVPDPAAAGCLRLEADGQRNWGGPQGVWVGAGRQYPPLTDADVVVLKPGESRAVTVDLSRTEWFVAMSGESPKAVSELQNFTGFRFVYRVPGKEACRDLLKAEQLWHGELMSQAFTSGGRWD